MCHPPPLRDWLRKKSCMQFVGIFFTPPPTFVQTLCRVRPPPPKTICRPLMGMQPGVHNHSDNVEGPKNPQGIASVLGLKSEKLSLMDREMPLVPVAMPLDMGFAVVIGWCPQNQKHNWIYYVNLRFPGTLCGITSGMGFK